LQDKSKAEGEKMKRVPCSPVAVVTVAVLVGVGGAIAAQSKPADPELPVRLDINFAQQYGFVQCPPNVPVGDGCLNVTLAANVPGVGPVTVQRLVFFNGSTYDPSHPTCLPDETNGTMTSPRGTLTFHAPGNVCFVDGIATYGLVITGGTGIFQGAIGGGQITVPPPLTGSTGRELWHVDLYLNHEHPE
jgi:hypothetical protein